MFIKNKYKIWHDNIIANAQSRVLDCYKEKHHILPRCLGGNNKKENLVELTAKEHFIVHMLLCKFTKGITQEKMIYASWLMSQYKRNGRNYKVNSILYESLKIKRSVLISKLLKGNKFCLGKKVSKETKQKLSKIRKELIWVNNNIKSKRIKKNELQNYLDIGYKLGRDKNYLTKEYSLNMSKLTKAYWDRRAA